MVGSAQNKSINLIPTFYFVLTSLCIVISTEETLTMDLKCKLCWKIYGDVFHPSSYPQIFADSGRGHPLLPTKQAHFWPPQTLNQHNATNNQYCLFPLGVSLERDSFPLEGVSFT
jgi:hypothetical protein